MPADRTGNGSAGTLKSIYRHPVKSMIEEELADCEISAAGLCGDRAYALIDMDDGKVASAKNPRKWRSLLECRAHYENDPGSREDVPAVRITTPDGRSISSSAPDVHTALSNALGRNVRLRRRGNGQEGLAHSGIVTDESMPEGIFFDLAPVHVLTIATLGARKQLYPAGQFDVQRFRPNLVIASYEGETGFVEDLWIGGTLQIGKDVQLAITGPCPRCVMTTLPQRGLPKDVGVLRAAARHNAATDGVYASVIRNGRVHRGDEVRVLGPGIAD